MKRYTVHTVVIRPSLIIEPHDHTAEVDRAAKTRAMAGRRLRNEDEVERQ